VLVDAEAVTGRQAVGPVQQHPLPKSANHRSEQGPRAAWAHQDRSAALASAEIAPLPDGSGAPGRHPPSRTCYGDGRK
jgi:hypothetical protein